MPSVATSTVENYVKQILIEQQQAPSDPVSVGRVASGLGVAPGTATSMMKSLAEAGLVEYVPRKGVRLSEAGERLALNVLRRHRLIELFLVKVLELDWSEIHEEAEKLEHVISERVLERIDVLLGHPRVDPHGDPIPTANGVYNDQELETLRTCPVNTDLHIARITDQESGFLRFAQKNGLRPGTRLVVEENADVAGTIRILFADGKKLTLGAAAAEKIQVE
ncbi:MAG: metal-dependent transcriptional regulator [Opitutales bacterium]